MNDPFFSKTNCDRCPNPLTVRTMSWFNKDTICMDCKAEETKIKTALREQGYPSAMEGCGYVPNLSEISS